MVRLVRRAGRVRQRHRRFGDVLARLMAHGDHCCCCFFVGGVVLRLRCDAEDVMFGGLLDGVA
jgi:hypothetical protein